VSGVRAGVRVAALSLTLVVVMAEPAAADHCGTPSDCFSTADAASDALLGMGFLAGLSTALSFVPYVGTAKGIIEALIGRDLLTGQPLSMTDRFLGLIPGRIGRGVSRASLPPVRGAGSETAHSLNNLGESAISGTASTIARFPTGSAFSGVYNPQTGRFLAYPSGETRLTSGEIPDNLVLRRGGHLNVNGRLGQMTGVDSRHNLGFTVFLEQDGSLSVDWLSRGVNGPNPSFPGNHVPQSRQADVIEALQRATGRRVVSR
jgi:hypothetical protein